MENDLQHTCFVYSVVGAIISVTNTFTTRFFLKRGKSFAFSIN
jgi:hypothetical protein